MRTFYAPIGIALCLLAVGRSACAQDVADGSEVIQASTLPKPLGCGCKLCGKNRADCRCQAPCPVPNSGGYYVPGGVNGNYAPGGVSGSPGYAAGGTDGSMGGESAAGAGQSYGSSASGAAGSTASSNYSNSLASDLGASGASGSAGTNMLGDFLAGGGFGSSNIVLADGTRYGQGLQTAAPLSSHTFKIADSESAWLRTRLFYNVNYFNGVSDGTGITRQLIGGERVMPGGNVSLGLRAPLYTVSPGSQTDQISGQTFGTYGGQTNNQTSVGDLTLYLKAGLHLDEYNGNAVTAGLAVVTPTGPTNIGGITPLYTVNGVTHSGSIQPFLAFYKTLSGTFGEGLFAQGFVGADIPFSANDATYLYNDYGLGYIFNTGRCCGLTSFIPTIEAHINTPLNNLTHGITATPALLAFTGNAGFQGLPTVSYTNQFNITTGFTTVWNQRTTIACAAALPVTTPHPYNYELQMVVTRYFGAGRAVPNLFR